MKKILLLAVVALVAYFLVWPVPVDPQPWVAPSAASYSGDFQKNTKLEEFEALSLDGLHGPEAAAFNRAGDLYASTHEGWVVRWVQGRFEKWVDVGGRPLGIAFDAQDNLWVANAYKGLIKVTPNGEVTIEVNEVDGIAVRYADDLDIAPNGKIYFSDASVKFSAEEWGGTLQASLLDIMEHGLHGRVIEFDPTTSISKVVMRDLSFANGIAMDPAGDFLIVAETGAYRIWKHWLTGSKLGQSELILENVPGFPDNVHTGRNGRFWVGLTAPRAEVLDTFSDKPFVRKMLQRLPSFLRPKVVPYGMVLAIDAQGNILQNLQAPSGAVYATTGVSESDDAIYVTSLIAPFLAKYSKEKLGI